MHLSIDRVWSINEVHFDATNVWLPYGRRKTWRTENIWNNTDTRRYDKSWGAIVPIYIVDNFSSLNKQILSHDNQDTLTPHACICIMHTTQTHTHIHSKLEVLKVKNVINMSGKHNMWHLIWRESSTNVAALFGKTLSFKSSRTRWIWNYNWLDFGG